MNQLANKTYIDFFVSGKPRPMPRPRAVYIGNHTRIYSPKKDIAEWWSRVKAASRENAPAFPWEDPLMFSLWFTLPRPQKHYYKRKSGDVLRKDAPKFPVNTGGDIDNYCKAVIDAIQETGCVFQNDKQVVTLHANLTYAGEPGCMVRIRRLTDNDRSEEPSDG